MSVSAKYRGMSNRLEPTQTYDGRLTVRVLRETEETLTLRCSSYEEAIRTVKEYQDTAVAVKIEERDDEVVFDSARMAIDDWVVEWRKAKRRLSVDVEAHDCPHDNVACVADDRCTQCQIDTVQGQV
jgi:hypothetical protein